jgi:membrane protease YdiL (CAAX protease family)
MNGSVATPQVYPSIRQSFSILGVVVLMAVACAPIELIRVWVGDEAATLVYYTSAFGLSFYIAHSLRKKNQLVSQYNFTMTSWRLTIPLYFGTLALLVGVIGPLAALIPMPESFERAMLARAGQTGAFAFLLFVVIAPLLEELIFRGVILDGLLRRYGPLTAILVSSVIFGLAHLNPWQFVTAFVLGCFMGWVYLRSGSLAGCVLIHMSANFSGYLLRLLLAFGGETFEKSGTPGVGGGTVLGTIAFNTAWLTVFVASVYWLRRGFDARRHPPVEPDPVLQTQAI